MPFWAIWEAHRDC